MRFKPVPRGLKEFIESGSHFLLFGHKEPDGDCVGSQLALASFLGRIGKRVRVFSPGPFIRRDVLPYRADFETDLERGALSGEERVIILDCSNAERIDHFREKIATLPCAFIDHHSGGAPYGQVAYVDPRAPSTTFLVQRLIESLHERPNEREAYLLFLGLCTDTGFFRHIESGSAEILAALGRLARNGVTPHSVYRAMYSGRTLASRLYIGAALARTKSYRGGRLLISEPDEKLATPREERETDVIYQQLLTIEGCEVLAFIRREDDGKTSVSLRSTGAVNVQAAAAHFGGGGHIKAAGFTTELSPSAIKARLIAYFDFSAAAS